MYKSNLDKIVNQRKTVAVEFKDGKLRLMQFQRQGKSYALRTFVEKDIPAEHMKGNMLLNPVQVGEILRQAVAEAKPQAPDTVFATCLIPQKDIFLITQDIPKVPMEEAEQVLANKIADLIPMPLSEVYWDWRVISYSGNKMQVQIAAASQNLVDSYMKCLEEAKLVPLLFEAGAEAASRVGEGSAESENLLLIELTESSALVSIAKNKSIIFSTDIPLEISPSGGVNTSQLLTKIEELIRYTQRQSREKVNLNSRARLYGRNEMVTKVLAALRGEQKSKFFLSRIRFQSSDSAFSEYIKNLDEYVPLVGAAVRGLPNHSADTQSINLVPNQVKEEFIRKELLNLGAWYTFAGVVNAMLALIVVAFLAFNQQSRLEQYQILYDRLVSTSENASVVQLRQQVLDLNNTTGTISTIYGQLYEWDSVFIEISNLIPDGITLLSFTIEQDAENANIYSITIDGGFERREEVLELADLLTESPYFEEVAVPIASLQVSQQGQFQIYAELVKDELLIQNRNEVTEGETP